MALLQSSAFGVLVPSLRRNSTTKFLLTFRVLSYSRSWRTTGRLYSAGASFGGRSRRVNGETNQLSRSLFITSVGIPFFSKFLKQAPTGYPSQPALPSTVPIEISQIMVPDDTNPLGNVHGGTILKLIEKAGFIVSCRHCNQPSSSNKEGGESTNKKPVTTVLVRLEHMDFRQPMFVGEVAQLQAAVTYTSPHSIEVTVDVWAENVITNQRRHTNTATLWYIAIPAHTPEKTDIRKMSGSDFRKVIQPVPQALGLSQQELEEGKKRYEAQKASRAAQKENGSQHVAVCHSPHAAEDHTVLASQTTLANIVLPSDCTVTGHLTGGSLMKTMDSAAGICAARHCHSRVVTAGIDEINFHEPITNGEMVFVTSRIIYTSAKSIEIEVTVEAENLLGGSRRVTNTAYFTFVSLGSDYKSKPVPQLKMVNDEERARFEQGKKRYEARKKARMEKLQKVSRKEQ